MPFALAALGFALAVWTVPALPSVTFVTSAQPDEIERGMRSAVDDAKLAAAAGKHKIGLPVDDIKKRITFTMVKTDEVTVSFDYANTLAAKSLLVDVIKNIGVPIVALELAKKKPPPGPARMALGAVIGFALGYALRQLVVARFLPRK